MKASELRIGNWYDHNGIPMQVTPNTIEEVWTAERTWCKPIPLTEEWLLKFGAKKYEFDNGQPNQYRIDTELYVIRDGVITDYGTSVKLPFVHTLQNLFFAKKGEELTVNEKP